MVLISTVSRPFWRFKVPQLADAGIFIYCNIIRFPSALCSVNVMLGIEITTLIGNDTLVRVSAITQLLQLK